MTVKAYNYRLRGYSYFEGCPVELGGGWSFIVEYTDGHDTRLVLLYRESDEHVVMSFGNAYLHPDDKFCRKIGRKVAFTKAVSVLGREVRTLLWKLYIRRFGV